MVRNKPAIVIVDDAPTNIRVLHACLGDGFETHFATSGAQGLEVIRRELPDLVLLDVIMPEMDGYEVCARLKEDPITRSIPIIFVTALEEVENETRGLSIGAVDYVTKPIVPAIVRARIGVHLELKRLRDQLEHLSATDGLTGIANRRRFDETLAREWVRAQRSQLPLSLVLVDVDHFKAFNDQYGHLAGDDALKAVAGVLDSACARPGDMACRYGGEEFVLLLSETCPEGALAVAERVQDGVRALEIPHRSPAGEGILTLSQGIATADYTDFDSPEKLLRGADAALYCAKADGRNRVISAPAGGGFSPQSLTCRR